MATIRENFARLKISDIRKKLEDANIQPCTCVGDKEHDLVLYAWSQLGGDTAVMKFHEEWYRSKKEKYYRWSDFDMVKDIYDRIGGVKGAGEIICRVHQVYNKNDLVAFCSYLDSMKVPYGEEIDEQPTTLFSTLPNWEEILKELGRLVLRAKPEPIKNPWMMVQPLRHQDMPPLLLEKPAATGRVMMLLPDGNKTEVSCVRFASFGKLPVELRYMVWELTIEKNRAVQLYEHRGLIKSTCRPPAGLHVHQESRKYLSKKYKLMFSPTPTWTIPGNIWFYPEFDTLYFGKRSFGLVASHDESKRIDSIVIERLPGILKEVKHLAGLFSMPDAYVNSVMVNLSNFTELETFTCVTKDYSFSFEQFESSIKMIHSIKNIPDIQGRPEAWEESCFLKMINEDMGILGDSVHSKEKCSTGARATKEQFLGGDSQRIGELVETNQERARNGLPMESFKLRRKYPVFGYAEISNKAYLPDLQEATEEIKE